MARKTYRKNHSRKGRHTRKGRKYTRKARKYSRKSKKGGNEYDKVNCCMCGKEIKKSEGLIPLACLQKWGLTRAHRICKDCWFDGPDAFATEGISHKCPGCEEKIPLTKVPEKSKNNEEVAVIDLTSDEE